jgi:hypothetical protein
MSSTAADGFDRQFGIGRAGDAPRQLIGNVEALCQSIDPGRVFIGKSLRGRGSPRRFAEQVQCLHLPDVPVGLLHGGNACRKRFRSSTGRFSSGGGLADLNRVVLEVSSGGRFEPSTSIRSKSSDGP